MVHRSVKGTGAAGIVVLTALLAVLISGCAQPSVGPTRSELIGVWVHAGSSAKLTLASDGKFVAIGVPRDVITNDSPTTAGRVAEPKITGSWTIGDGTRKTDFTGNVFVQLNFHAPQFVDNRSGISAYYESRGARSDLFVYLGDPDNSQTYNWEKIS